MKYHWIYQMLRLWNMKAIWWIGMDGVVKRPLLVDCKERNVEPEQPYKGTFNVRISPELHRNIAVYAIEHGKSPNAAVEEAIGNP